jgi:hypothetical protein
MPRLCSYPNLFDTNHAEGSQKHLIEIIDYTVCVALSASLSLCVRQVMEVTVNLDITLLLAASLLDSFKGRSTTPG